MIDLYFALKPLKVKGSVAVRIQVVVCHGNGETTRTELLDRCMTQQVATYFESVLRAGAAALGGRFIKGKAPAGAPPAPAPLYKEGS